MYTVYKQGLIVQISGYRISGETVIPYSYIVRQEPWYFLLLSHTLMRQVKIENAISVLINGEQSTGDTRITYALANLYMFQKQYSKAESRYRYLYYALPRLLRPKYLLAKLYYISGEFQKWKEMSQEVVDFKPKISSQGTIDMQAEIQSLQHEQNEQQFLK